MNVFEKEMEEIPNEYRSLPFWSWNDKLDQEELKWQIRQMHQQGVGGFFMHARDRLKTELPFVLQNNIGKGKKLIERVEVLSIAEWNADSNYREYPIKRVTLQ